ncbi:hypothetical protein G9A89_016423 [Geosiphon pyriformis]|nr:hypothetical protein G9A89_016423 [Geosiphon pyriformis]
MQLHGFSLEILVEGESLDEYSEPFPQNAFCIERSYVCEDDAQAAIKSDKVVYAAVRDPSAQFKVRVSCVPKNSNNLISANVYVDGKYDWTYTALANCKPVSQSSFENVEEGIQKRDFKFSMKQWIGSTGVQAGCFGAVSVVFFRARRVAARRKSNSPREIHQIKQGGRCLIVRLSLPKSHRTRVHQKKPRNTIHVQEEGEPLAVLHLHYRSAEWLRVHGLIVPSEFSVKDVNSGEQNENPIIRQITEKQVSEFSIGDFATFGWSKLMTMTRKIFDR